MGRVRVQAILAVLALAVGLAGCGGGGSSSSNASVASTTASSSSSTTTTTSAASSSSTASSTSNSSSTTTSTSTTSSATKSAKPTLAMITLSSPAFAKSKKIPARYTCDASNQSPPLQWSKVPAGTAQLLLFVLDLGGGAQGSILWAVGGINPDTHSLAAGSVPAGAVQGRNSQGKAGWAGICPAKGKSHSYVFLLYALRKKLSVASGFEPKTIQSQLSGNTAGAGLLFGTYQRS